MNITFRPIDTWPGKPTKNRKFSQFKVDYQNTLYLLERELKHLGAEQVVIQLDLTDSEIRLDGLPRATAKPASPIVAVSFESHHGPLRYFTDVFLDWKANLRAIALGLEALRKVDRYGITKSGQQYRGWRALESADEEQIDTEEQAARFISEYSRQTIEADTPADEIIFAYRRAAKRLHPDVGGDPENFKKLQQARDLLLAE